MSSTRSETPSSRAPQRLRRSRSTSRPAISPIAKYLITVAPGDGGCWGGDRHDPTGPGPGPRRPPMPARTVPPHRPRPHRRTDHARTVRQASYTGPVTTTEAFEAGPDRGLERTPPQDLAAERGVLGGMMLSKDAIADVVETVRGNDFYRPAHEMIFEAIIDLYGRGEPADLVTVSDELSKRGELQRVGGGAYLADLIDMVPTAANAGFYAEIVVERATLRRLVEAGTRIVQLGYAADGGEVDEVINEAQAQVYAVTERGTSEDFVPLGEVIDETLNTIEATQNRGGQVTGIPTGFAEFDDLTQGLHPGQMVIFAGRPAMGKTTLGMDVLRSASIHNGMASVIFSLEMDKTEIHAPAVGRSPGADEPHARRFHGRPRLAGDGPRHEPHRRCAAVHGRLGEHVADGDPRQVPSAEAEARPAARGDRLPAADELGQEGRIAPAGGLRVLARAETAGQGDRGAGDRDLAAEPRQRAAHRQDPHDERPARVRLDRAGRGPDPADPPRGLLREGVRPRR